MLKFDLVKLCLFFALTLINIFCHPSLSFICSLSLSLPLPTISSPCPFHCFNPPLYFLLTFCSSDLPYFHVFFYLDFILPLSFLLCFFSILSIPFAVSISTVSFLLSFFSNFLPVFSLSPPLPLSSLPSSLVLFDLLVNILGHNLAEPAYEAEVAQLEYKLVAGEHGLVIKVKGFNHKLPVSECFWTNHAHKQIKIR